MNKLRLGRFDIPRDMIIERPEVARAVTRDMIIYRAEMMLHKDSVEYLAISDMFDEISQGESAPYYWIKIEIKDEEIKVGFQKA